MTVNIEKEIDGSIDMNYEMIINTVVKEALIVEGCPYEIELNVIITNNEEIKKLNVEYRGIDKPTDVLSFPLLDYAEIGDFKTVVDHMPEYFNIDTKELVLGDVIISIEKVYEQAEEYGHSKERELGFLVAHSMLHLFGYDHMEPEEEEEMKRKQEIILSEVGLVR